MPVSSWPTTPKKLKHWYEKGFTVPLVHTVRSAQDLWPTVKGALIHSENAFFLDSTRYQGKTARYSYFGWKPFHVFKTKNVEGIVSKLRTLFASYRGHTWNELPFFTGGAVGYLSYELAHAFEALPDFAKDDLRLDLISLLFVRDLLVYDHKEKKYFLVANLIPSKDGSFDRAFKRAQAAVEEMGKQTVPGTVAKKGTDYSLSPFSVEPGTAVPGTVNNFHISNFKADSSKQTFKRMVLKAKEYIEAGDIYQANLSQRFSFDYEGKPEAIYERLRTINPSPFSSFLKVGPLVVASVSPERLIKLNGERCETRPIAGTRPRGENPEMERRLRRDLIMSAKERAEHIMLVDLERNDLGRVSKPHSVRVSELMTLEPYSHVVHIVSNVVGQLKKGYDRFDLLRAVFPGGTITGCPKIRSMEIIEELEPFKRHLYTGSIGYLDFKGDMDLNIVIRSLILYQNKGYLQVGAGIVYDSDPEAEYWETLHKGKALIDALCLNV
ncbi:MAG: anthranilate synthase component I family protein [Candidatus Omnitrophica bacterium]|nr:anthranilate synthase component I family protein [Candidatus Omnitrophota bacterium]